MEDQTPTKNDARPAPGRRRNFVLLPALGLAAALFAVAVLAIAIFLQPAWFFNDFTLARVPALARRFGVELWWRQAHLVAAKPSFAVHRFSWRFEGFCAELKSVPVTFCGDGFTGQADLNWSIGALPVVGVGELGRWNLGGGRVAVGPLADSPEPKSPPFDWDHLELPSWISRASLRPSSFSFDSVRITTAAGTIAGSLQVDLSQEPTVGGQNLSISAHDGAAPLASICWQEKDDESALDWWRPRAAKAGKCLRRAAATVALSVEDRFVRVARIGPVSVEGDELNLNFAANEPAALITPRQNVSAETPEPGKPAAFPAFLAKSRVGSVAVGISSSSVTWSQDGSPWRVYGSLTATANPANEATIENLAEAGVNVAAFPLCLESPYLQGCFERLDAGAAFGKAAGGAGRWQLTAVKQLRASSAMLRVLIPEEKPRTQNAAEPREATATNSADWQQTPFLNLDSEHYLLDLKRIDVIRKVAGRAVPIARGTLSIRGARVSSSSREWQGEISVVPFAAATGTASAPDGGTPGGLSRLRRADATIRVAAGNRPLTGAFSGAMAMKGSLTSGERLELNIKAKKNLARLPTGTVAGVVSTPSGQELRLTLAVQPSASESVALRGAVSAAGVRGLQNPSIKIDGTIGPERARLLLTGAVAFDVGTARFVLPNLESPPVCNQLPPPGPNLDLTGAKFDRCSFDLRYDKGFVHTALASVCRVDLEAALTSPEAEAFRDVKRIAGEIALVADASGGPDNASEGVRGWNGRGRVDLKQFSVSGEDKGFTVTAGAAARFSTSQAAPAQDLKWELDGSAGAELLSFASLVEKLRHLPYAIPAPFNVLDGPSRFSVRLTTDAASGEIHAPFTVMTALRSKEQRLNVNAEGDFTISGIREGKLAEVLDARLHLRDVALAMPRLSIQDQFPALFPDKRIAVAQCGEPPRSEPASLTYRIAVDTPVGNPMRISTNLAKSVVPVDIPGLTIDANGVHGGVVSKNVDFEVFRRRANVKSFAVALNGPDESPVIDGNIEFKYTDIIIHILVRGSAGDPIVTFESDPIRTQREIVAILLYGEDAGSDSDQQQSADDMSAALADRMIGLASLYLLATTPVESVRYNPATKVFNAKVRLDQQTSLNLGSSVDSDQRVGVRRRLNGNWSVETNVEKDELTGIASGTALLEWSKRF